MGSNADECPTCALQKLMVLNLKEQLQQQSESFDRMKRIMAELTPLMEQYFGKSSPSGK